MNLPNVDPKAAEHAAAMEHLERQIAIVGPVQKLIRQAMKEADNAAAARIASIREAYAGGPRSLG
jgi:hypothetical protein